MAGGRFGITSSRRCGRNCVIEGIGASVAFMGTLKVFVNAPDVSAITVPTVLVVVLYVMVTELLAGNPDPATVTSLNRPLFEGIRTRIRGGIKRSVEPVRPELSVTVIK